MINDVASRDTPGPCVTLHTPTLPLARAQPSAMASAAPSSRVTAGLGRVLTFAFVALAWVPFRATSLAAAKTMTGALVSLAPLATLASLDRTSVMSVGLLLLLAWFAPNTQELTGYEGPSGHYSRETAPALSAQAPWLRWTPSPAWALATGLLVAACILSLTRVSEFLYFQF